MQQLGERGENIGRKEPCRHQGPRRRRGGGGPDAEIDSPAACGEEHWEAGCSPAVCGGLC